MGSGRSKGSELHRHRAVWSIDRPGLRETDIWQPGWQTELGKEMKSRGGLGLGAQSKYISEHVSGSIET